MESWDSGRALKMTPQWNTSTSMQCEQSTTLVCQLRRHELDWAINGVAGD